VSYRITDECIGCGTCADECLAGAIVESGDMYRITDQCTDCGTCIDACPTEAIVEE